MKSPKDEERKARLLYLYSKNFSVHSCKKEAPKAQNAPKTVTEKSAKRGKYFDLPSPPSPIPGEKCVTIFFIYFLSGFSDLSLGDQMCLLQGAWPEVLALSLAHRSLPQEQQGRTVSRLAFAGDLALTEQQAAAAGMVEFYHHVSIKYLMNS